SATAAARNALTSAVVSISAPLHAGDFLSLYLTGLGATALRDGLEYAATTPVITIGGRPVTVAYAGRSPGYAGLDQINVQIPAGLSGNAVPVSVTSNGRTSNTAFLAIQ
ncbi:MAG: repeat containing protein, partial [Bryobacterales bacterium]|nr:repeat containing protein [Bryobacterales bacterium]